MTSPPTPPVSSPNPLISAFALVFQHAPLPTSPVDRGGAAAPSPPAGRVGVGGMFESHCKDTYQSRGRSLQLPPSCRFPPLREGNRARVRFPLLAGGTLRRGSSTALVFVNCVPAIGLTHTRAQRHFRYRLSGNCNRYGWSGAWKVISSKNSGMVRSVAAKRTVSSISARLS